MPKPDPIGPPSRYSPSSDREVQAIIDGVDELARAMERKWGVGRLRLLVSDLTRARFDNQLAVWNDAIWNEDIGTVRTVAEAVRRAWSALDAEATQAGAEPISPDVWEGRTSDGRVFAITRTNAEAYAAKAEGRAALVYTVDELARIVEVDELRVVNAVKTEIPGAEVTSITTGDYGWLKNGDSLDGIFG